MRYSIKSPEEKREYHRGYMKERREKQRQERIDLARKKYKKILIK